MGLISTAGENLLGFLEFQQVLSSYDRDLCNPLWSAQEMPVDLRVAKGPLGIPLRSMTGLRPFLESVPEPEVSSPVLKWILGYDWSLHRGVIFVSNGGMHVRFPPEL